MRRYILICFLSGGDETESSKTMLSTKYRLELTDICCRMITDDAPEVSLEERIWMTKLCEKNPTAKSIAESLLCPDYIPHDYEYLD